VGAGRQEQDRGTRLATQLTADLEAVDPRQAHVEQDQVRRNIGELLERFFPGPDDRRAVALALEGDLNPARNRGLILDDHDRAGHSVWDSRPIPIGPPCRSIGSLVRCRPAQKCRHRRLTVPGRAIRGSATPMDLEIAVNAREVHGKQNKRLRTTGVVPGVLFGKKIGSIPVQVDAKALEVLYHQAGRTSVVKVSVDGGQPTSAIIKSLQRNPLTRRALHVDLFAVDLTQEMLADIPLVFTGTSHAVEMEGAILFTSLDHLKVRGLPGDLPHEIDVDL